MALIAIVFFTVLAAPGITWVNTDSDGTIYLASARHIIPSHPTGSPLYNMLNIGWIRVFPFGPDAWKLALQSAIFGGLTAGLLYRETRSLIAPLIYCASGVVVSQATIIESYSVTTFIMVGMYTYRDRPKILIAFAICGLGIHHLMGLTLLPIIAWYWKTRRPLKVFLWLPLGVLWYIYLPLTAYGGSPWFKDMTFESLQSYFSGQTGLILGLAILTDTKGLTQDALVRSVDLAVFIVGGFLAALIPIVMRRKHDLLLWCFLLPIFHYFFGLPAVAWVYLMPAFAFGAIMASEFLAKTQARYLKIAVASFAVIGIFWNFATYDIGRSLDPLHTNEIFYAALSEIPDDSFVYTDVRGWEFTTAKLHELDTGKPIHLRTVAFKRQTPELQADQIANAAFEGKLYLTDYVDPEAYHTILRRAEPWEVYRLLMRDKFAPLDIPMEFRRFKWSETTHGKNGKIYRDMSDIELIEF